MVIERRRKPPSALSFSIEVLWRCFTISKKEMPINEEIREKEIRVIGPDGAALGIMSSKEALQIAQRENLDLVNISPKAVPPVCKIMNYGKYRFDRFLTSDRLRRRHSYRRKGKCGSFHPEDRAV